MTKCIDPTHRLPVAPLLASDTAKVLAASLDALHLSCAEAAGADQFLTCDDRLLRRYSGPMTVQNSVTFITSLT